MNLEDRLTGLLRREGADLVGIARMDGVENCPYLRGVAVAVVLPKPVILDLQQAPTEEYFRLYHQLNQKLNRIVLAGEAFLRQAGYRAWAQTTDRVETGPDHRSPLPHKTIAARAGLGWIGKNCLLVTPQYGPAVRLSSLLTDAPLTYGQPILESRCGDCGLCVGSCPAGALKGALWQAGMEREQKPARKPRRKSCAAARGLKQTCAANASLSAPIPGGI